MLLKVSGKIRVNLYYTYNGKYSLLSKDVELSSEWKEVSFKLDEGLEFGLGMPSQYHPNRMRRFPLGERI
jgi:hypothetical protein